jgi:hypothetical protein
MFTWVCQRCGREVDVAQTKCPNCEPAKGADTELGSARGAAPARAEPVKLPPLTAPPTPDAPAGPSATKQESDLPPPGPAAPAPSPDVFSLKASHLLVFVFALLAAVAVAIGMSQPELLSEWRERLTAPAEAEEGAPIALPAPGAVEAAGLRAWRDEKAEVRIRATLVNHQMSPDPALEYQVLVFARADADTGKLLGSFEVKLDEPLAGRSAREVEASLDAPGGLAEFPHWSELVGRVQRPGGGAGESDQ